jgi:hypothetical protein
MTLDKLVLGAYAVKLLWYSKVCLKINFLKYII